MTDMNVQKANEKSKKKKYDFQKLISVTLTKVSDGV